MKKIVFVCCIVVSVCIYINVSASSTLSDSNISDTNSENGSIILAGGGKHMRDERRRNMMMQRPDGGYSNNIAGTWDCGTFGVLTLKQKRTKYRGSRKYYGTYTYKNGKLHGGVNGNTFRGAWKQNNAKGFFKFKLMRLRKTVRMTHLKGKWKFTNDSKWRGNWNCARK